jgi:hypothetical protein
MCQRESEMYYTEKEMTTALQRACQTINHLTESCTEYTRNFNDCFALLAEYDLQLRGKSKARDVIDFEWNTTREFVYKLAKSGLTLEQFAIHCDYEIVRNKKPKLGDIAFKEGAMVNDGNSWMSTNENNTGCHKVKQSFFLELGIPVLARPIRS